MGRNMLDDLQGPDKRLALEAMRDKLAVELLEAEGKDAAAIAREMRLIINEIDTLPGGREVSKVDDLAARREARRAEAKDRPVA